MALEQTGLEFVAENEKEFTGAIDNAAGAMQAFEGVGESVSQSFDVFGEIITGALRRIGEMALETLINMTTAVKDFALGAFEGALDAERGLVKLRGAIKRAGDSAAVTEDRALELAQELKGLAGGSDDAVIAAEAMLLKFQDVGEDVFPAALRVSLDLAEVLGTDAAHAAEMLGRALGNPEQASRLLRQAGVFLNDEEKELIKSFAESGNAADAQVFILDKLTHATGGAAADAAATLSGQWDIFKETIADTAEGLATGFIPVLQSLFEEHIKPNLPVIQDLMTSFANLLMMLVTGDFKGGIFGLMEDDFFIDGLLQFRNVAVDVFNWIMTIGLPMLAMFITNGWNWLNDTIQNTVEFIQTIVLPAFYRLSDWFMNVALPVIQPVINAIYDLYKAFTSNDPDKFFNAIGRIFSELARIWDKYVKPAMDAILIKLIDWITAQIPVLQKEFERWQPAFVNWIDSVAPEFLDKLGNMLGTATAWLITQGIPELIKALVDFTLYALGQKQVDMEGAGRGFVGGFIRGFGSNEMWPVIAQTAQQIVTLFQLGIANALMRASEASQMIVSGIGMVLRASIERAFYEVSGFIMYYTFQLGYDIMRGIAEGIVNASYYVFSALWNVLNDAINSVKSLFGIHSPSALMASLVGAPIGEGIAEGILSTIGDIKGAMQGVTIGAMNSVSPAASGSQMTTINNSRASSYAPTLNVNSYQSSQGIVSDFSILQAMSG